MKYIDEFRDGERARALASLLASKAKKLPREVRFMEFCGGHTHAIYRYGIHDLLPTNVTMIHGPGCPVCVLPVGRLQNAIEIAQRPNVILCTYADMMRVPALNRVNLLRTKAEGADVRMVYSVLDALEVARANPDKEVVFLAIGFETTTPPTASALLRAQRNGLKNFFVFCNHVLTPPALKALLDADKQAARIDGFVGPAHVSTVIGSRPYELAATEYHRPVVIAGFEPLDVLQAIVMLVDQVAEGRCVVENEYTRAVTPDGNPLALEQMKRVFVLRDSFEWRGLGAIPNSAVKLAPEFAAYDAEIRYEVVTKSTEENTGCSCGAILTGTKTPKQCPLFAKLCTPENPVGACMVSSEGACAAYYLYGRHRD